MREKVNEDTFQLTDGKNKAKIKMPNKGPLVADIIIIEISIIPVSSEIQNVTVIIIKLQQTPKNISYLFRINVIIIRSKIKTYRS